MGLLDYFRSSRQGSAAVAKERLQILVAQERGLRNSPDYLPMLKQELLEVIAKYVHIDADQVQVSFDRDGDCEVLELNVMLPEGPGKR
ncbi:cell division topological specificity factor MinE [Endothiovibrio diazotrophicus]